MNRKEKYEKYINYILLPVVLFLMPLLRCNIGVDVTDTGYSLGGFIYQGGQMGEDWVRFATFLATEIGSFFARLPFGDTMIGMNLYTGMFVSVTALLSYFFCINKLHIPAWNAWMGEILAISLCWCPTIILYNYVTYFLFTVMIIALYKGITEQKKGYLILAGIAYGCNVMTRFPNITHGALIIAVWYGAWRLRTDKGNAVLQDTDGNHADGNDTDGKQPKNQNAWIMGIQQTLWCMLGFLIGFGGILLSITIRYGLTSYLDMINSLFGGNGGVEGHSLGDMVWSVIDAYLVGCKWMLFAVAVILGGFVLFAICKDRFMHTKRILYIGVVFVLFRFYYGRGMFNFRYYAYESMLQWAVLFLILSIITLLLVIGSRSTEKNQKIMAVMILLLIMVTPLGSDNYLYQNINNLFLVAPVVLYWVIGFIRAKSAGRTILKERLEISQYPVKCMLVMVLLMTLFQSVCFGATFVFRDSMLGEKRDTVITENEVLKGMRTNRTTAESIEGITVYCKEEQLTDRKVILYGTIPAMSCFLQMPSALSTSWADLPSYSYSLMEQDLSCITAEMQQKEANRPIILLSCAFDAWLTEDAEGMKRFNLNAEVYDKDAKAELLKKYMKENNYKETYLNEQFVIYE